MTTETRYMKNADINNNGLACKELGTSQSTTSAYTYREGSPYGTTTYCGIRVWKRASGGSETEITAGTPVAQVSRSANGEGIQSNTWNCPETTLTSGDSIVVRVYDKIGSGSWTLRQTFQTEDISGSKLNAATWTVYYYTKRSLVEGDPGYTASWFYYGTSTYNSRVEGFAYEGGQTYYKSLFATETAVVALVRITIFTKTLSIIESSVVALGKVPTCCRTLAVVESTVVSLSRMVSYFRTLAATCVSVASLVKTGIFEIALAVASVGKALLKGAVYEPLADYVEGVNCFLMEHTEDWSSIVTMVTLKGGRDASGNDIVVKVQDKDAIKKYGKRLMIVSETQWTTQTLCELRALQILSDLSKPGIAVKLDCEPNVLNIDDAVVFRSTSIGVDDTFNVQSITREYGPGEGMVLELSNKPPALTDLLSTLERAIQRR